MCRHAIHMGVGRGVPAHVGPTHITFKVVRRPSSVGRLLVNELLLSPLQKEGRAKQVGVLSVCLAHLTLAWAVHIQVIHLCVELQNE